jgi:pimeloyl-ACP methyl ester carboxylesterase
MIKQLLFGLVLCASTFAQRPLGTFTLGSPTTNACPTGASCRNFTVTIPDFPYAWDGELAVRTPTGQVNAVDVFFSWEAGTAWWGGMPNPNAMVAQFFNSLLAAGHQVILIRWNNAWYGTSPTRLQLGQLAAACRPATVMQWVKQHYPSPSFNVIGTSAGGAAIAYALADYGIVIGKAVVDSGPPFMELRKACEHYPGYEFNAGAKGIVDTAYGYYGNGPCVRVDKSFENQWDANSVETGGVYQYPQTVVHLIIGTSDNLFIQNRGRDYFNLLTAHDQNAHAQYHAITGMGHGVQGSLVGLNTLLGILTQ